MSIEALECGAVRRILLMGSSEITFYDNGAGVCLADLMESELAALRPECSWEIRVPHRLSDAEYGGPLPRLAERVEPDLIALWLARHPFSEETVSCAATTAAAVCIPMSTGW